MDIDPQKSKASRSDNKEYEWKLFAVPGRPDKITIVQQAIDNQYNNGQCVQKRKTGKESEHGELKIIQIGFIKHRVS